MATESETLASCAVRGLLSREERVYVSSLLVSLVVYNVALKAVRVATQLDIRPLAPKLASTRRIT
jgi:hypothetical protein